MIEEDGNNYLIKIRFVIFYSLNTMYSLHRNEMTCKSESVRRNRRQNTST